MINDVLIKNLCISISISISISLYWESSFPGGMPPPDLQLRGGGGGSHAKNVFCSYILIYIYIYIYSS